MWRLEQIARGRSTLPVRSLLQSRYHGASNGSCLPSSPPTSPHPFPLITLHQCNIRVHRSPPMLHQPARRIHNIYSHLLSSYNHSQPQPTLHQFARPVQIPYPYNYPLLTQYYSYNMDCRLSQSYSSEHNNDPTLLGDHSPTASSPLAGLVSSETTAFLSRTDSASSVMCVGCGAPLQSDHTDQQGYVNRDKLQDFLRRQQERKEEEEEEGENEEMIDEESKEKEETKERENAKEAKITNTIQKLQRNVKSNKDEVLMGEKEVDCSAQLICQRCFSLKHYNSSLNITLQPEDYLRHLRPLAEKRVLILLVLDVLDFPGSLFPDLSSLISSQSRVMIVANKIDLLPQKVDGNFWLRLHSLLVNHCVSAGLTVAGVQFASAKTGEGLEHLTDAILHYWGNRGDIYLLGCTNAGKSSLFNHLLRSLCGASPGQLGSSPQLATPAATISHWPGTTLGLLRFPIMSVGKRRRLEAQQRAREREMERKLLARRGGAEPFVSLPTSSVRVRIEPGQEPPQNRFWLYDTPGAVNDEQLINLLTTKELNVALSKKPLKPRTFLLQPEQCLLLGGLARLDYIDGDMSAYFTVFAASNIPVHVTKTSKAGDLWSKHLGSPLLKIPFGSAERLSQFPSLQPQLVSVLGEGWKTSVSDVILSSTGWVAITAGKGQELSLMAHTPGGKGVFCRQPSLCPSAVNERGRRSRNPNTRATFNGRK